MLSQKFPQTLALAENTVDIWWIGLEGPPDGLDELRQWLSEDEIQRANRFHFEKHRRRFIVARGALRHILGRYLNVPPQSVLFSYGEKGKPELAPAFQTSGICFNLSHSSEVGLLAVARGLTLGVDVEAINPDFGTQEIAERFFSADEVKTLQALPVGARVEGFFSCWTRKEAYIKALGEGLSVPLNSFIVSFGPNVPAALLRVVTQPMEVHRWSLYDIEAGPKYKAALMAEGKDHHLQRRQWEMPPDL